LQFIAAQAGLEVHEYPPAEIKKAVAGTGAATKLQIQFMVTRLLRLKSAPKLQMICAINAAKRFVPTNVIRDR